MFILSRLLLLVSLCVVTQAVEAWSAWDRDLPDLPLEQVTIRARSLPDAWQDLNTALSTRSILVEDRAVPADGACVVELGKSSLREAMQRLLAHYPNYTSTQDPVSGLTWIHPRSRPFALLLPDLIDLPRAERGVPSGTSLLTTLEDSLGAGLLVRRRGMSARSSMEWPVDLPAGRSTLRDVLQRLVITEPSRSLFIQLRTDGSRVLDVISTLGERTDQPRAGAVAWWRTAFNGTVPTGPSWDGLMAGLGDADAQRRTVARGFLGLNSLNVSKARWHDLDQDPITGLWVNIALARLYARLPDSSYREVRDYLQKLRERGDFATLPPALALVAACELARLAKGDTSAIDHVAQRADLAAADLTPIADELYRLARMSAAVRGALERHHLAGALFPEGVATVAALTIQITKVDDAAAPTQESPAETTSLWRVGIWSCLVALGLVVLVLWSTRRKT